MATSAPLTGWSSVATIVAGLPGYTFTATPAAGGSVLLQWSTDNVNWVSFAGHPTSVAQTGSIPVTAVYVRGMSFGAAGTFDVAAKPAEKTFSDSQVTALQAMASGAGNPVPAKNLDAGLVRAAVYPMNEGAGTTLAEQSGRGPSIAVTGVTSGAWAVAGWFSHDSAGNVVKIANSPYIDGIIDMSVECSVLLGMDLWLTAWPSATESAWAMHRSDLAGGGVRMPLVPGTPGRISVYYKPSGGADAEAVGITLPGGSYLGQRLSLLTELRFVPARSELRVYLWINGIMARGNVMASGTPPLTDAAGGVAFSGYGNGLQKLGSNGSGARTRLCFVARHSGADRNIAGRLAAYIQANAALPSWLQRI